MLRNLIRLLFVIIGIALLRYVIALITRAVSGQREPRASVSREPVSAGELKKDPVCGTYIAASSSVKLSEKGETIHFCSTGCRDKYLATKS